MLLVDEPDADARLRRRLLAREEPDQRVDVKGRLMLTRKKSGGWQIFGYDLNRNARTVGEESR